MGSKSRVVLTYVTETIITPERIHESLQNPGRRALAKHQLNVGQTLADRCLIVWGKTPFLQRKPLGVEESDGKWYRTRLTTDT